MKIRILFCCIIALTACTKQKAQRLAAAQLIDPGSAQFRNVQTISGPAGERVCGEINGKNRMGAYAGFTRFIVNPAIEYTEMEPQNARSVEAALNDLSRCRSNSYGGYVPDCSFDQERYAEAVLAESFARDWARYCTPGGTSTGTADLLNGETPMDVNWTADSNMSVSANLSGE